MENYRNTKPIYDEDELKVSKE